MSERIQKFRVVTVSDLKCSACSGWGHYWERGKTGGIPIRKGCQQCQERGQQAIPPYEVNNV